MSDPNEPRWITYEQAIAIHSRQLRRFGGAPGLRDEGMLRSALERPINKWRYEQSELAELAAAYAFRLAKNHAFVDGNKRIAFMGMMSFLFKNGILGIENVGGDLDAVTGKRVTFAFFPWNWDRGDGCIIRLVAMIDKSQNYRIEKGTSF